MEKIPDTKINYPPEIYHPKEYVGRARIFSQTDKKKEKEKERSTEKPKPKIVEPKPNPYELKVPKENLNQGPLPPMKKKVVPLIADTATK